MTVEDVTGPRLGAGAAVVLGWTLTLVGALVPLTVMIARPGAAAALTLLAVTIPAVQLACVLAAPERFEHVYPRLGERMVNVALALPAVSLFVAGAFTPMVGYGALWLIAAGGAALGLLAAIWAPMRMSLKSPLVLTVFLILNGALLGWSGAKLVDIKLDPSPGQAFSAPILFQGRSYSRSGVSHYVILGPFGPVSRNARVSVSASLARSLQGAATACVTVRPGALGMAWYRLGDC